MSVADKLSHKTYFLTISQSQIKYAILVQRHQAICLHIQYRTVPEFRVRFKNKISSPVVLVRIVLRIRVTPYSNKNTIRYYLTACIVDYAGKPDRYCEVLSHVYNSVIRYYTKHFMTSRLGTSMKYSPKIPE